MLAGKQSSINVSTLSVDCVCELYIYYYRYSALGSVWAETRAQSGDCNGSGTLHPGQVLRGSLPLLSPIYIYIYGSAIYLLKFLGHCGAGNVTEGTWKLHTRIHACVMLRKRLPSLCTRTVATVQVTACFDRTHWPSSGD